MHLSVERLVLSIVAGQAFHGVGDVQATINCSFHAAKDASSGGGASQTDVQVATECSWSIFNGLHEVFLAGDLGAAAVKAVQSQFLENTTSSQQTGAISSSVVGQTGLEKEQQFRNLAWEYSEILKTKKIPKFLP